MQHKYLSKNEVGIKLFLSDEKTSLGCNFNNANIFNKHPISMWWR